MRRFKADDGKLVLTSAGVGLGVAVFFFGWTNFGVWLLGDGTFYAKTWQGLVQCYAMGVPFFRAMLVSGVVLVPLLMASSLMVQKAYMARKRWFVVSA